MIKSPLRYPGGKSRAVRVMSKLIPEFDEYREPFLGGGSLFVYLKQNFSNKTFWVNELYTPLYHFWAESKNNVELLIDVVEKWKSEFKDGKELHLFLQKNIEKFNPVHTAAAFFVFNRISFSGTSESGGYSNAAYKGRFTASSIQRVKLLSSILKKTKITNLDYQEIVDQKGENVFLYLDPPIFLAKKSALYGKNGNLHKTFDHYRFADVMKNCKHRWLITYDDSEFIRELFSFANIFEWDMKYGMRNVVKNSNQSERELFISNYLTVYPIEKQEEMFEHEFILKDSFNDNVYKI